MPPTHKTITQVFNEFLADQKTRLSPRTFSNYESVIDLFKHYLEGYWPGHDQDEYERITSQGGTYCDTFGPEEILDCYSDFLGYFMPNKVMGGKELMQASGTVTKKLAKWMAEKGYAEETEEAQSRAKEAAKDLPTAQDVLKLLEDFVDINFPAHYGDEIEDHFTITKIEPGKLWLEPLVADEGVIGPVPVPVQVTKKCGEMWDISGVVVKTKSGWRFREVWKVSP